METTSPIPLPVTRSLSRTNLAANLRGLWAVTWREWFYFVRYPTWVIALVIWPMIFPAIYILSALALAGPTGNGLNRFLQVAGTDNFLGYILVGTTVWMWVNTTLWNIGFALRSEQWRGTLESNWLSPTSRFSFLIGTAPTHVLSMLVFVFFTVVEFGLFFGVRSNGNLLTILVVILLALPSLYGIGFAFASLVLSAREANTFVFLVRGLVMIFCGVTYPLAVMPVWMQSVARWLPPTIVINAARSAILSGATLADLKPDLILLALYGVFWLTFGYIAFVLVERRARRKGSLGQY
jgi:ABC-2 type transport system permease protein